MTKRPTRTGSTARKRVEAETTVIHIVQYELAPGVLHNLRNAKRLFSLATPTPAAPSAPYAKGIVS